MKELSEYTTEELQKELNKRRKEKPKIKKPKCFNCKNRICYTKAKIMERKGELKYKVHSFRISSICLKARSPFYEDEYLNVSNSSKACEYYEPKQ